MKIYIVQIDMTDDYTGDDWQNAEFAFRTLVQAQADVEFKIDHYGIERKGLRIVDLELV